MQKRSNFGWFLGFLPDTNYLFVTFEPIRIFPFLKIFDVSEPKTIAVCKNLTIQIQILEERKLQVKKFGKIGMFSTRKIGWKRTSKNYVCVIQNLVSQLSPFLSNKMSNIYRKNFSNLYLDRVIRNYNWSEKLIDNPNLWETPTKTYNWGTLIH